MSDQQTALNQTINRWSKIARCKTVEEIKRILETTDCALCIAAKSCINCILRETKICQHQFTDLMAAIIVNNDDEAVAIASMILEQLMIFADSGVNK